MRSGRPSSFSPEVELDAIKYIQGGYKEEDGQVVPSVVGLAVYLGVSKSTLYKWAEDGRGTFSDTLELCNDKQHLILTSKGLTSDFNSAITKLMLSNHGYSEKTSTEITGANGGPVAVQEIQFIPVDNND